MAPDRSHSTSVSNGTFILLANSLGDRETRCLAQRRSFGRTVRLTDMSHLLLHTLAQLCTPIFALDTGIVKRMGDSGRDRLLLPEIRVGMDVQARAEHQE